MKTKNALFALALLFIILGIFLGPDSAFEIAKKIHPRHILKPKHIAITDNLRYMLFAFSAIILLAGLFFRQIVNFLKKAISFMVELSPIRFWVYFILLFLISRIAWQLSFDFVVFLRDSLWYKNAADSLYFSGILSVDGHLTAFMPVGYPASMTVFYWIFGYSIISLYIMNVLAQFALITATFLIAREIFNRDIARLSSIVLLFLPSLLMFSSLFLTENGFTAFLILSVFLLMKSDRSLVYIIFSAVCLAFAIYYRAVAIPLIAIFAIYLFRKFHKKGILRVLLFIAIIVLIHLPWSMRNYKIFDKFVPVSTNGGLNLYIGNNPQANGSYWWPEGVYDEKHLNEAEKSSKYRKLAINYMISHPIRTIKLSAKKLFLMFITDSAGIHWAQKTTYENLSPKTMLILFLWTQINYIIFMVLSIFGIIKVFRMKKANLNLYFVLSIIIYLILIYSLFFGYPRFRFPIMPLLSIFSAIGLYKSIPLLKIKSC